MKKDERVSRKEDRESSGNDGRMDRGLARRSRSGCQPATVSRDETGGVPGVRPESPVLGSEYSEQAIQGPFQVGDLIFNKHSGEWAVIMRVNGWDDPYYPGGYFGTLYFANPDYRMLAPAFLRDPTILKNDSEDAAGYLPLKHELINANLG